MLADYRAGDADAVLLDADPALPRACSSPIQLGISEERIRVDRARGRRRLRLQAADLRRGGPRAGASRKLGRPVKWIATRSEDMATTHHGRDQIAYVTLGAKRDGTLTGDPREDLADCGAYLMLADADRSRRSARS